jgi:hypothetical protein
MAARLAHDHFEQFLIQPRAIDMQQRFGRPATAQTQRRGHTPTPPEPQPATHPRIPQQETNLDFRKKGVRALRKSIEQIERPGHIQ